MVYYIDKINIYYLNKENMKMSYIDKMIGSVMRNLKISDSILTEGKNDNNALTDELKNIEKSGADIFQRYLYGKECILLDKNGEMLYVGQKIKCIRGGNELTGILMFEREVVSVSSDPYENCEIVGLYIKYDNGAMSDSICEYEPSEIEIIKNDD